jgi:hypothetical protein
VKPKATVGRVDWLETAIAEIEYLKKFLPGADPWGVVFFQPLVF